jgi:hypothetical protein
VTPERWQRLKEMLGQLESADPAERVRLMDVLCDGDAELRREAEGLLVGMDAEDEFLDAGAVGAPVQAEEVIGGRFELVECVGEGGMGQVWSARDRQFGGELVAIKAIHERIGMDAGARERFKRELQLARRISHPNICRLNDLVEDSRGGVTRLFLMMEFLEGETLAARLKREGRIQPAEALDWMRQLCAGLAAAHEAGVIHRDLKPGNILLAKSRSGTERPVILDFGLALGTGGDGGAVVSISGAIVGTPEYMAPEQIRSETATAATDVYALGLILYEMLRGARPFAGKNTLESWMRRIREGPPGLSGEIEDLPAHVDGVIARCLEYEPGARFASATAMWAALEGERRFVWRWPLSRRWTVGLAACAVVAVGVASWALWGRRGGPGRDAVGWYEDARRDLAEGAALRATKQLRRALAAAPEYPAAYAALAEAQLELDQNSAARESILRATSMAGGGATTADRAHVEGVRALLLRECDTAVSAFRTHVRETGAGMRPYAMMSLARAMERCEQPEEARKALAEAAALDGRNAAVLVRAAALAQRKRATAEAEKYLGTAEAVYRERANFEGVTEVMLARGVIRTEQEALAEAGQILGEAMELAKTTRSMPQQIRILFQQSNVARRRGELETASRLAGQAVGLARDNDLETLALQGIFAGANVHTVKNQNVEAVAELERALEIATRYRDEENQARAQLSLAVVYQRMMQPGKAEAAIAAALPYYERKWPGRNLLSANYIQGQLEFGKAKYLAAAERFRRVHSEAGRIGDANLQQLAVGSLAMTLQETGELEESLRMYGAAAEGARKAGRKRAAAFALLSEAEAASAMGQFGRADERVAEAGKLIDGLDKEGQAAPLARKVLSTAVVLLRKGRGEEALRVLAGARGVDGAPGAAADLAYYRCSAYLLTGQVREGLAACGELRAAAERSGAARYALKADLLEAGLYERVGEKGKVAERLGRVLANTDSRFDVLAARLIAASSDGEDGVSPELEKLRLQLGEPVVSAWMNRPDNKRQFANWREKGRGR